MTSNGQVQSPRGSRNTKQRAVVLDAVRSLHNHPTSADIYDVVHRDYPNVSRATVYRNLSVLSDRGEVLRIPVPNAADRYDFRCDNHFHAKCSRCGGVFDIETEGVDPFARIVNDYGFQVTGFDLAGNSAECVGSRPPIWVFRRVELETAYRRAARGRIARRRCKGAKRTACHSA